MTIGDMRRLMLKQVVPESVIPQNIINFLMDENAQLPEPDAFTFLNRLRGLGIGSADFLYLLEGCGAPEAAVEKIRANPAMNLQGLIMTLEGAGMTSQDYTRILYTARQIWERTLTLRLQTSGASEESADLTDADEQEQTAEIVENVVNESAAPVVEDNADEAERSAQSKKLPYPDATEELMSVDFGSEDEGGDNKEKDVRQNAESDVESEKNRKDNSGSSFGIGNGSAVDLFGGEAVDGKLGYSQSFTESFVNDRMVDFAEDELAEGSDDGDDLGSYYGDFEQYEEEAQTDALSEKKSDEPFEVHIASYDIPEEPDEFETARLKAQEQDSDSDEDEPVNIDIGAQKGVSEKSAEDQTNEFVFVTEEDADLPKKNTAQFVVKINYGDEDNESQQTEQYNGETTKIIPIAREVIDQNINAAAEKAEEQEQAKTAVQKSSPKTAKQISKAEEDDDHDDDGDSDFNEYDDEKKKPWLKKGAVIAAGVGAAVLVGANIAVMAFVNGSKDKNKIAYAENADQIFAEIYYSHADGIAGGGNVSEYQSDYSKVFGDLLICGNGLGAFTVGDGVYDVSENVITASTFKNSGLTALDKIEAGDGRRFVAAFELGDVLIAVYNSDNECGYLSIKGGETVYTVRQSGRLTDLRVENGTVGIGSVYTPTFNLPSGTDRFGADATDVYLPRVGTDYRVISPTDIILSKTKGYSYGLSAVYSLDGGTVVSSRAALGDPVYASADNLFVMNGSETKKDVAEEYGLLISAVKSDDPDDNEPRYERIGKVGCAASSGSMSAVYEGGTIVLRGLGDKEFNEISTLNIEKAPTKLRFSDNYLTASDDEGVFLTADCSGTTVTESDLLRLKRINGDCGEGSAITLEADTNGIKLTRYVLENGAAKEIVSFTRQLTSEQIRTLVCGTSNAMAVTKERVGAAYSYFDGVSIISEYVTLSDQSEAATLFDDKTGFEYAFVSDGTIYAVCSKGAVDVVNYTEPDDIDNNDNDSGEDTPLS